MMQVHNYIPGTCDRYITPDISFRPIKSWHSNTYAGEGLTNVNGDGSGCIDINRRCQQPLSVTHRIYKHDGSDKWISAFLSYPNGMGAVDDYFWEIYNPEESDIEQFDTELEMETKIKAILCA